MMIETITQSRGKLVLGLLGSAIFVAGGRWMINDPDGSRRYSAEELRAVGFVSMVFFGACGLAMIAQLLRPSKLLLGPDGLTFVQLWRRKTWAWRDVRPFTVDSVAGARLIYFEVAPGPDAGPAGPQRRAIPGYWNCGIDQVCAKLNAARTRWS